MTDTFNIPQPKPLDHRGILICDLVETNERLERENVELRRDLLTVRDVLSIALEKLSAATGREKRLRDRVSDLTYEARDRRRDLREAA